MPDLYQILDGVTLRANMHEGQTRAWNSTARIVAMIAGSQGGKTSWGPLWLLREIANRGAGDYLAVTSNYDLFKLKMLPIMLEFFEHTLKIGKYWTGDKIIELCNPDTGQFEAKLSTDPMWGRIILRSAVSRSGLESASAKAAWLDEAGQDDFTLDAWDAIRRRLTLSRGRILITTTPYNLGWLKQQVVDKANGTDIEVVQFASIANPSFPPAEFEQLRGSMPAWKFRMFYQGRFERPAGMIYADYVDEYCAEGGHKCKPFDLPTDWPRYVGVDPGAVHTAVLWMAHDIDNDIFYIYRESLEGGKSTPEHAEQALATARIGRENVVAWRIGQKAEVQQRLDWQAAGVEAVTEPPIHDVEAGIDRVIALLRTHRIYFFDTCTGLLDEIATYSRELDAMGNPTEKIKNKAAAHRLDALRYLAVGIREPNYTTLLSAPNHAPDDEWVRPEVAPHQITDDESRRVLDAILMERDKLEGLHTSW